MKLPKTVAICGKTYAIKKDREGSHGSGGVFEQEIVIGTKGLTNERVFETFLHEVVELAACEKNYRYGCGHSESSVFVMSHKEFEHHIIDVATAIFPMLDKKWTKGSGL